HGRGYPSKARATWHPGFVRANLVPRLSAGLAGDFLRCGHLVLTASGSLSPGGAYLKWDVRSAHASMLDPSSDDGAARPASPGSWRRAPPDGRRPFWQTRFSDTRALWRSRCSGLWRPPPGYRLEPSARRFWPRPE